MTARFFYSLCLAFYVATYSVVACAQPDSTSSLKWLSHVSGVAVASYMMKLPDTNLRTEVVLCKVDPSLVHLDAVQAADIGSLRADIRTLTRKANGLVGINTNFFGVNEKALGVIIRNGTRLQTMHNGGSLLTGVFYLKNQTPAIVHRSQFKADAVELAFQSGPRLIENGKPLAVKETERPNRRSGVAVTADRQIILFATMTRFPGATLPQLQKMLLNPQLQLNVTDALNFDGGSSSQLYISSEVLNGQERFLTGGDRVPVGLIVKKRPAPPVG